MPGETITTNLKILESLHEAMKQIRQARQQQEGSGVKLNRIYREAVEQFIASKPQQQLLKDYRNGLAKTGRAAGD